MLSSSINQSINQSMKHTEVFISVYCHKFSKRIIKMKTASLGKLGGHKIPMDQPSNFKNDIFVHYY